MSISFKPWIQKRYERTDKDRVLAPVGARTKPDFRPVYDSKGVWHLEQVGEIDVYSEIQSHADSCDINIIMNRYRNGDTSVLSRIQGVYGDVSDIPTNYAEIVNAKLKAEEAFYGLAPEIREKFNNSVEQFMSQLGTKEGLEAIGYKFDEPAPAVPADQKEGADE